jgi:F0F1-type ATP synthase assembly protein I
MQGRNLRDAWTGANQAWDVIGLLLAGIIVWGAVGWLLDLWLDFRYLFLPIGMVLGVSIALWMVYLRYGKAD